MATFQDFPATRLKGIEVEETPWVTVESVCHLYGVKYEVAKNKIYAGTFPVPTYKVGKLHVIDRMVHEQFFQARRDTGLAALRNNP